MTVPKLPAVGLGCASLGKPEVTEEEAVGTILAALEAGVGYLDSAPLYGCGLSEERVGRALQHWRGATPLLSTKVGYVIDAPIGSYLTPAARRRDYSSEAVRRSLARSLERLGVDHIDIAYIHGPDGALDEAANAFQALSELRDEGLIGAIGVGTNRVDTAIALLERCPLDAVLIAGRLTLLDRVAEDGLLAACAARGTSVVAAGVFNSGILAAPEPSTANFDYAPAASSVVTAAEMLGAVCRRHGLTLKVAAVNFARRHPSVRCTLLGAANRTELDDCLAALATPVPEAMWSDLETTAKSLAL